MRVYLFRVGRVFGVFLGLILPLSTAFADNKTITSEQLSNEIQNKMTEVSEFRVIREMAKEMGMKVYLFGGSASAFAHYVNWDLKRRSGDTGLQALRFDYDYTNIFRSNQDLDLVVDGPPEKVELLQTKLRQRFDYFQASKVDWDIRPLRDNLGDREALLGNPNFLNQHTDSNSTGLIEITETKPGEAVVRDIRDWDSKSPFFLRDIVDGRLHYYFSDKHSSTARFRSGKNPTILSVIRFLTKAFQFGLEIRDEDRAIIKKLVTEFDPNRQHYNDYVRYWIDKNAKKLIQNSVDIEKSFQVLDELGLREKLVKFGSSNAAGSMSWWLSKSPLKSSPIGKGTGATARSLGLSIVAHDTRDVLAYDSIVRAHTGSPNVLISRKNVEGETAYFGDGFYTMPGTKGAWGNGLSVRFKVNPDAREGSDFVRASSGAVIFLNKNALEVIPEQLGLTPEEYFTGLAEGKWQNLNQENLAVLERFRRRLRGQLATMQPHVKDKLERYIMSLASHADPNHELAIDQWFNHQGVSPVRQFLSIAERNDESFKFAVDYFINFNKKEKLKSEPQSELVKLAERVLKAVRSDNPDMVNTGLRFFANCLPKLPGESAAELTDVLRDIINNKKDPEMREARMVAVHLFLTYLEQADANQLVQKYIIESPKIDEALFFAVAKRALDARTLYGAVKPVLDLSKYPEKSDWLSRTLNSDDVVHSTSAGMLLVASVENLTEEQKQKLFDGMFNSMKKNLEGPMKSRFVSSMKKDASGILRLPVADREGFDLYEDSNDVISRLRLNDAQKMIWVKEKLEKSFDLTSIQVADRILTHGNKGLSHYYSTKLTALHDDILRDSQLTDFQKAALVLSRNGSSDLARSMISIELSPHPLIFDALFEAKKYDHILKASETDRTALEKWVLKKFSAGVPASDLISVTDLMSSATAPIVSKALEEAKKNAIATKYSSYSMLQIFSRIDDRVPEDHEVMKALFDYTLRQHDYYQQRAAGVRALKRAKLTKKVFENLLVVNGDTTYSAEQPRAEATKILNELKAEHPNEIRSWIQEIDWGNTTFQTSLGALTVIDPNDVKWTEAALNALKKVRTLGKIHGWPEEKLFRLLEANKGHVTREMANEIRRYVFENSMVGDTARAILRQTGGHYGIRCLAALKQFIHR